MKQVLVVVDMQHDFIDGALGTKEAVEILPRVEKKIRQCLEAGYEIVFTLDTHHQDYLNSQEGSRLPVPHCVKGTKGWQLPKLLDQFEGVRFEKNTFASVSCAQYLATQGYELVELVGLCTDICVISNALLIKAYLPETIIRVDQSCCAGVTPNSHETALSAMAMCQIEVV